MKRFTRVSPAEAGCPQGHERSSGWELTMLLVVSLIISCNTPAPQKQEPPKTTSVPFIEYALVKEYPHDPAAFTEGLQMVDDKLYESTGQYGRSDVRITDLTTGKVSHSKKLEDKYFGEGITVLNGKLYQLTYRENTGFVYDAATLKLEKTFMFNSKEGWGMTNDGTHLIYDNGGSELIFMDPVSFQEVKRLNVTNNGTAVDNLNELEYVNGFIYANQWQENNVYKIDANTGNVVGIIDLNDLRQRVGISPNTGNENDPEVLNGIAYNTVNRTLLVTGKNWPKIVEIKLQQ